MSIASDQYMQKMETGMVDVRQCVIKMEASLQKLVADSKAMQQMVKQSLAKDKQGAATGKSDAGADAKKGDAAKNGQSDIVSSLSKKLADGIGSALMKLLGLDKNKSGSKDGSKDGNKEGAQGAKGEQGNKDAKDKKDSNKELLEQLKGKSTYEVMEMAVNKYAGTAEEANKRIYDCMTSTLGSCSEALIKFVTTGKFSFNDFAKSVIQNILKIQAQAAVAGLAQFLIGSVSSFFGSSGTADMKPTGTSGMGFKPGPGPGLRVPDSIANSVPSFGFADGGEVPAGINPIAQLHEKEMVLPSKYADVIRGLANTGGVSSGGGININTSVSVSNDGTSNQKSDGGNSSQRQLADMINDQTKAVIAREMRQGGLIWNMRMGVA